MRKKFVFFCTLYLIATTVFPTTSAPIPYETTREHVLGEWESPGKELGQLNAPTHVSVSDKLLVISDSGNARVVLVDTTNWTTVTQIDKFTLNSTPHTVGKVFQTVRTSEGMFYSVVDNNKVIAFDQSGNITSELQVPIWEFGSSEEINIAVDTTTTPNKILLSFLWSNRTYEGPQVFLLDQLVEGDITPIANISGSNLKFGYSPTLQPQILTIDRSTGTETTVIATFSMTTEGQYKVTETKETPLSTTYAVLGKTFVQFPQGYWFQGSANDIYNPKFNFSGTLDEFGGLGALPPVDALAYIPSTGEVVFASRAKHIVAAMKFGDLGEPSKTQQTTTQTPWIANILSGKDYEAKIVAFISLLAVAGISIAVYKKRQTSQVQK